MAGTEQAAYAPYVLTEAKSIAPGIPEKPQRNTLLGEIHHLRDNWQEEGLPQNWVDLPGVGFLVGYQLGFLDSDKLKHLGPQDRKNLWTDTTEYSLRGWIREYLEGKLTFPGELQLYQTNGQWKMRDTRHGAGLNVEDTLSKKERNGAVWSAVVDIAKPFLVNAPDGSIIVKQSPSGTSGIRDNMGMIIDYPDSHFEIMQKKGDRVYTYTIKTDYDYGEHREAMRRLRKMAGQPESPLNEKSLVEDYVLTTAAFDSSKTATGIADVIDVFKNTRLDMSGSLHAMKNKKWDEVYEDISKNREDLWRYDKVTDLYIDQFVDYARNGNWTKDTLKEALSATILRLSKYVLNKEKAGKQPSVVVELVQGVEHPVEPRYMPIFNTNNSYGVAFNEVKNIAGCAGGNQNDKQSAYSSRFDKIFNSVFGITAEEAKNDPNLCQKRCAGERAHFHCPGKKEEKEPEEKPAEAKSQKTQESRTRKSRPCNRPIIVGAGTRRCTSCGEGAVC